MFGGLSVKGQSKEKSASSPAPVAAPSSSSGFSFLQSSIGASSASASGATTVGNDNTAAAATATDLTGGGTSLTGSAFGFLSPSADASVGGISIMGGVGGDADDETSATAITADAAAPPSIFAGLNTTHSATNNSAAESSETVAPSSGFSFLSTPSSPSATAAPAAFVAPENETNNNHIIDTVKSTTSAAGSSFSFMNSLITTSSSSVASSNDNYGELDRENCGEGTMGKIGLAIVQEENAAPTAGSSIGGIGDVTSGFSFLSLTTSENVVSPTTMMSHQPPPTVVSEPPPPQPSDLLSLSNAVLPVGSGVAWSSSTVGVESGKKVVKKKRGKRVGIGSSSGIDTPSYDGGISEPSMQQQQPTTADGSSFHSPTLNSSNTYNNNAPPPPPIWRNNTTTVDSNNPPATVLNPHDSPPMRIKAERAMVKAEEFIREKQKQRNAIALAAERAMQDRGGDGGPNNLMPRPQSIEGGWKLNNTNTTISPTASKDETYQAARAAAEEAKKLATDHAASHSKGKTSLFSSLFHRKTGGASSSHDNIASYSSHGGVISQASTGMTTFQRSGSGSAVNNHSPLPPTMKMPDIDDDVSSDNVARVEEVTRRWEMESAVEQQRRDEFEQQQMENRRREEERLAVVELQRRREEGDRMEKQRIEAEKRRAPREKIQLMIDNLAVAARTATDDVARLREALATLREQKLFAEKAERYAAQQIKFSEAQQTIAIEEEDFEAADRLGTIIEQHTNEREEQTRICKGINESIAKVDEERKAASKAVAACFSEIAAKLVALQSEVDNRPKEEEVLSQFAATSKKLSSESERLANDLKHIERDEKVFAEEEKELEGQIDEETKEFVMLSEDASKLLEEVNITIEGLRKQLADAEAKASDLKKVISSQNHAIENVRNKYSRQIGRLEKKSRSVKESRADWTSEKESIEKAKIAHEAVLAAHAEEMVTRERIIEDIKAERSVAMDLEAIATSAFEIDADEVNGEHIDDGSLDGEVLKYEAIMNEASQNVLAADNNIAKLQEELSAIEVRIPALEAAKKAAAANRDFKSAGQASKEIKDAISHKEQCQAQLAGEALERKQFAEDELQKITALWEEKKKIAADRNMEAGLKQMDCLTEKIDKLKLIVKKFAKTSDDPEDDTMNVSLVGAFVIESQICVLEAEKRTLGEKYGVPVEPTTTDDAAVEESSLQSAPTFDSDDVSPSIDKSTLEKYMSLRNEIQEIESAVEEAVTDENFDKAADLEERARSVRDMFESEGFSSEKFKQALEDFMEKPASVKDCAPDTDDLSSEKVIDSSVLEKYSSLCALIQELEASIEIAVANENFDDAAKLEEDILAARSDIESLGFSARDFEEALASAAVPCSCVDGESQDGQRGVGNVEDIDEAVVKHGEEECTVDVDDEETKLNDKCATEEEEEEDEGGEEEKEDAGM